MDEDEDIVQVKFSGAGAFTVNLDRATSLPPAFPSRYKQEIEYVTGMPSVVIEGAVVTLVEVINSTGMGGMQLSNTVFIGSPGKVGIDTRGESIAVRLNVGDIDTDGDDVPHLLFSESSFTTAANNPGLRITGGDLLQTNGARGRCSRERIEDARV